MSKKNMYLVLAILGLAAPFIFFLQIPGENGFDLAGLIRPLFANNLMKGLAVDLTIAVIVFWVFVFAEANKLEMKAPWLYVLATLAVGLCFAIPLFLYARERRLENS